MTEQEYKKYLADIEKAAVRQKINLNDGCYTVWLESPRGRGYYFNTGKDIDLEAAKAKTGVFRKVIHCRRDGKVQITVWEENQLIDFYYDPIAPQLL